MGKLNFGVEAALGILREDEATKIVDIVKSHLESSFTPLINAWFSNFNKNPCGRMLIGALASHLSLCSMTKLLRRFETPDNWRQSSEMSLRPQGKNPSSSTHGMSGVSYSRPINAYQGLYKGLNALIG